MSGMNWFVVRHPDIDGAGVVPESALDMHRARGWYRCSDPIGELDKDQIRLGDYTTDLDAPPIDEPAKAAKKKEQ